MLGSEFHFREKIPLGVLGLDSAELSKHVWFHSVPFSEQESDKTFYALIIANSEKDVLADKVNSLVEAGYSIVTNIPSFILIPDVPLLVPEVNRGQVDLLKSQRSTKGKLIGVPSGAATALSIVLKPLIDTFGVDSVLYQGREKNVEAEVLKIFSQDKPDFKINSLESSESPKVFINLKHKADPDELIQAWEGFKGQELELVLPSSHRHTIRFTKNGIEDNEAMITITNLSPLQGDYQYTFNLSIPDPLRRLTIAAELLVRMGHVYW